VNGRAISPPRSTPTPTTSRYTRSASRPLIDVTPLYKYEISGPDAARLVDRVVTRDVSKLAVDRVVYTPWCDEDGKVVDDGTLARRKRQEFFWTAADPCYRWFTLNAAGLDVRIADVSEQVAAVALQGPRSRDVLEGHPWSATVMPVRDRGWTSHLAHRVRATSATRSGSPRGRRRRSGTRSGKRASRTGSGPRASGRSTSLASRPA
jgi:glycine cleavage system aminomethyltransferase T